MRYLRSYAFLFDSRSWAVNLLATSICQVVPIVGPIVFTGYAFEIMDGLEREGEQPLPTFAPDRLKAYLQRGLWPTVVQMMAMAPAVLLAWIVAAVLVAAIANEPRSSTTGVRVMLAVLVPLLLGVVGLISVPLMPATLFVGLRHEVTEGVLPFVQDFLRRVGRETVLAQLFVMLTGTSVVVLGALLFCLPMFPALALVHCAQYHLLAQLYRLYQERGGASVRAAALEQSVTAAGSS